MSKIHRILDKAERDGFVRRTAPLQPAERAAVAPPPAPSRRPAPELPPAAGPEPGLAPGPALAARAPAPALPKPGAWRLRTAEPAGIDPLLVAALDPDSDVAERYRALRTHIAHGENGRQYRALVVTSPMPGDGKTVTAINLALTMAQEFHKRVVIVDADLRKGMLHRLLGLPPSPGLCEVLTGEATLEEALVSLPDFHLSVLPAGAPTGFPAEMLGSAEMRRTVDLLRTQYDRILLDTPPVVALADVGVLTPVVDGVLMVVRAGRTTRPAIDRALGEISPAPVLGLVLNDVEDLASDYPYPAGTAGAPRRLRFPSLRRTS